MLQWTLILEIKCKQFLDLTLHLSLNNGILEKDIPTYSIRWKQIRTDLLLELNHTASKPNVTPTFTNPKDLRFLRQGMSDTLIRFFHHWKSTSKLLA